METCDWPSCKKEDELKHELELIEEESSSVNLPFCKYHYYIVIGGHFKAKQLEDEKFEIVGPFEQIEIAEQVMGAREMITVKK